MNAYVLTFGYAHTEEHKLLELGELDKGYVVIEAPTRAAARRIGVGIFGTDPAGNWSWAFDYVLEEWLDEDTPRDYPAGELLRIRWHVPQKVDWVAFGDISDERQWGWGEELEVLKNVVDDAGLSDQVITEARRLADEEIEEEKIVRRRKPERSTP